ncbi:MAG TPA: polynucleotide adenylyltransferase, partial [Lachnospiraceae bacterium]|nr:polynucleotide adenylyltransferase [Lachnospiraceae bacterium]
ATEQNNQHHQYSVGIHTIEAMKYSVTFDDELTYDDRVVLRLTMLLHDMGKPALKTTDEDGVDHFKGHSAESVRLAGDILKRLKFDNATINKVSRLVKYHDHRKESSPANVRRTIVAVGKDLMPLWFKVRRCDVMGQSTYIREEKLKEIDSFEKVYRQVLRDGDCLSIAELKLNGNDLMENGVPAGRKVGQTLSAMLDAVLEDPSLNTREGLLGFLKDNLK